MAHYNIVLLTYLLTEDHYGDVKTRVDDNEVILSNDEDKASAFCSYFSNVFSTIDDGTLLIM